MLGFGQFDQAGCHPRLLQDVLGVKPQAVPVEFDRVPQAQGNKVAEVVGELCFGQLVDRMVKVVADPPDRSQIGFDGRRSQILKQTLLHMRLAAPLKVSF